MNVGTPYGVLASAKRSLSPATATRASTSSALAGLQLHLGTASAGGSSRLCASLQPGEPIVLVATTGLHRSEAFAAAEFLMDFLKTRAPFWKKAHAAEDSAAREWIAAKSQDDAAAAKWGDG